MLPSVTEYDALDTTYPTALDIADATTIILIDDRVLIRTCFVRCLRASKLSCTVSVFDNAEQEKQAASRYSNVSLIIVAAGGRKQTDTVIKHDLPNLCNSHGQIPIVLISDVEDFDCIMGAMQAGAKGYIPTSLDLKVTMGIIKLVKIGGGLRSGEHAGGCQAIMHIPQRSHARATFGRLVFRLHPQADGCRERPTAGQGE